MSRSNAIVSGLLLASVAAFAGPSFGAVYQTGTVTAIVAEGNGFVSVYLTGTAPTTECPSAAGRWTIYQPDDPLFKTKVAALLTAAAAGKTVSLASTGVCGNWNSNVIYYVVVNF